MFSQSPCSQVTAGKRFISPLIIKGSIALSLSALFLLFLSQLTDIDFWFADLFYDPARGLFPYDKTWFARDFMHGHVKNVIIWSGYFLFFITLWDIFRPIRAIDPLRRIQIRILALSGFLEPLLIRTLKYHSALHCPWGIDRYGGNATFLRLLDPTPSGWAYGHYFPAGHASAGMWLAALGILWFPHSPKKALAASIAGLSFGLTLGWVQQMRGQHFLTHTLWTAWFSCAICLLLLAIFARPLQKTVEMRPPSQ